MDRYRCRSCGNRTRFDVVETKRTQSFLHFDLGGTGKVEEQDILQHDIESVTCRWCGKKDAIEVVGEGAEFADDPSVPASPA